MTEIVYIAMMGLSVTLFALGGTGFKWARRFLMPVLLGLCLYFIDVSLIQVCLSMGTLCGVMTLGYGESVPSYWGKLLIGISYILPSLIIGYSWWCLIVPVGFTVMFFLSNWEWTKESFTWKLCEGAFGFLICASLIGALQSRWVF